MTIVRQLNEAGMAQFRSYLEQLAAGASEPTPTQLLSDSDHSEALNGHAEVENIAFPSKQVGAEYLRNQLAGLDRSEVDYNVGLWSWLSLFYFDQVCPFDGDRRQPGQIERHIPSLHAWTYYRHLLVLAHTGCSACTTKTHECSCMAHCTNTATFRNNWHHEWSSSPTRA